jgi:Kelch motif protein/galactose oxidase-like protein
MKKSLLVLISICGLWLLNGCGTSAPPPAVATHFSVTSATATPTAGTAFNITVNALDSSNAVVSSYTGTVHFTSSNGQPVQPASATLTNGTGTFAVTLNTAGSQTITATDGASLTGTSTAILVVATGATHFSVTPATATPAAGTAFNFTVAALDASNSAVANYSGTVHFTSSDPQAMFSANDSALTKGVGTFSATLKTSGAQTITATDTVTASIAGTANLINVSPGPATHFSVTTPLNATARASIFVDVMALDAYNNLLNNYAGTIHFASTDPHAILPKDATLPPNGTGNFSANLETAGPQTITAADTLMSSIKGSSTIDVTAAVAIKIASPAPPDGVVAARYNPQTGYENCVRSRGGRSVCHPCNPGGATATLPACTPGYIPYTAYGFTMMATGGTGQYTWRWAPAPSSSLPPGLSLSISGMISGLPTPLASTAGNYIFDVTVNDSGLPPTPTTVRYTIALKDPPPPVISTTPALSAGALNLPFSFTFAATGGLPPYQNWGNTHALPAGIPPLSSAGVLSGTPTQIGSYPITVTTQDSLGQNSAPQDFILQVFLHGFKATASMGTARTQHAATLLNSGKVLMTGGLSTATAELYDPTTGIFAPTTGNMSVARLGHTATLLADGRVLITGGEPDFASSPLATAELYDPIKETFTPTGSMSAFRVNHTATLLDNGKVLVTGGFNGSTDLATAELYDPATGKFTLMTNGMETGRVSHTATLLTSGEVLLAGGFAGNGYIGSVATAELFDPVSETFTATTRNMETARSEHTATLLNGGKVLVTGGALTTSAELYDPTTGIFTPTTGSMETARTEATATLLSDGTVLVAGGNGGNSCVSSAELFDPTSGTFTGTGSMQTPREAHTATLLKGGTVLVTGGVNNGPVLATSELYQ